MVVPLLVASLALIPDSQPANGALREQAERLIGELVTVGRETTGAHSTAWSTQFMAIDEEPRFTGGILGSTKPVVPAPMRRLVQMGIGSLPALLDHLEDQRPTELDLRVRAGWFSDEYDTRRRDPKRMPTGVNTNLKEDRGVSEYRLKVGDLCYVLVGQIVNRKLQAARYQPSACEVFNSPCRTKALAEAARQDWAGLTPRSHRESLISDLGSWSWERPTEAIKRLLFYYPSIGEKWALKMLCRQYYDFNEMWRFTGDELMTSDSAPQWKRLYGQAESRFGTDAAKLLPCFIYLSNWETPDDHPKQAQDRASKVLKLLFPWFNPYERHLGNAVDLSGQRELVEALQGFSNSKIDAAVHAAFVRALKFRDTHAESSDDAAGRQVLLDRFALACVRRPSCGRSDEIYRRYFERRIQDLEAHQSPASASWREDFRSALRSLGA